MAIALALASTAAHATTLEQMTMSDMAKTAEFVVVGTAVDAETVRENGQTYTHTTFSISDDVFGGAPRTVTVVTPGGTVSTGKIKVAEVVAGSPMFLEGQPAMLFLNEADGGDYQVTGFNQGYFSAV